MEEPQRHKLAWNKKLEFKIMFDYMTSTTMAGVIDLLKSNSDTIKDDYSLQLSLIVSPNSYGVC